MGKHKRMAGLPVLEIPPRETSSGARVRFNRGAKSDTLSV
jgi:hypothetical protein